jgi:uncharacterized protein (DUF305 family)
MKFSSQGLLVVSGIIGSLTLAACAPTNSETAMNHSNGTTDHASMSMDDMMSELKGKTGDDFDKAFIEMMIPHHQGAIDMARAAQQSAKHQEIKNMADDIISAQQSEIDMMRGWQKSWGYSQ